MKLNQKGLAHPVLIGLVVLVVGAVGFTAYRIGQSNSNSVNNSTESSNSDAVAELEVEKEESETVKIPDEEKTTEPVKTTEDKPAAQNPDKKDKVYLKMNLVSAVQNGNNVKVHSKVEKAVSGTCNFKLYRDGFEKFHTSNKISNSQDCVGQIDVSNMPNYEGWSLHVWFDGDDGKTYAYQDNKPFALTDPN